MAYIPIYHEQFTRNATSISLNSLKKCAANEGTSNNEHIYENLSEIAFIVHNILGKQNDKNSQAPAWFPGHTEQFRLNRLNSEWQSKFGSFKPNNSFNAFFVSNQTCFALLLKIATLHVRQISTKPCDGDAIFYSGWQTICMFNSGQFHLSFQIKLQ